MYCCANCFRDAEIKAIIQEQKLIGNCDFCGQKNVPIYQTDGDTTLSDLFDELLDTYTTAANLPETFPKDSTDLMKNMLHYKWNIFNVAPDCIYRLITSICHEKYNEQPELFDAPIGLWQSQDQEYLKDNGIMKNYAWADFVEVIKRRNRFHTDFLNKDVLYQFIYCVRKTYKAGTIFYRGRICPTSQGFSNGEMGPPPPHLASAGRANPEGISILYLADTVKTTLHEIRAGVYDYVTIGRFELLRDMEVINLAGIDKISPFLASQSYGIEFTRHAVNIEPLKMISQEIAKPLRRHDSLLDYLPTQYVSDYIKSKGFDGIEYISTMSLDGVNLAVFDQSILKCTGTTVYDVKSLIYSYDKVN
ncbi:RES family NAD+ phosphorylase [Desulfitobacterium chlororespirans]|uniref:RES domain-containing protein n=2 Tax=Desulfitobacterium TaxID=36853 RepID=A0A1M7RVJ3_9FIRM|nr:RES family NAD+ phosphorylase [Desulfitobacterium chlororespirans]SHN50283.1 RES domain-containing protein [Desulfitobacterium chlororespirans DSM 11544]